MKSWFICFNESSLKIVKNPFYFIFNYFCYQNIYTFVLTFWSYRKSGVIRNTRLISKFMTSQPCQQTITILILPNIFQSKSNQIVKLSQLIEYNKRHNFLRILCRKWGREISSTPLFVFLKSFIGDNSKWFAV